jgi:hypothetical protein
MSAHESKSVWVVAANPRPALRRVSESYEKYYSKWKRQFGKARPAGEVSGRIASAQRIAFAKQGLQWWAKDDVRIEM